MPALDFASVRDEWNKAEKSIKLAEQVNGDIVNPAIYELRYAGRRIIEALATQDQHQIDKLLADAHFDCCRARHDAIDAATSKIAADLNISIKTLGAEIVLTHFTEFPKLYRDLSEVRDLISVSRENRNNRDAIYASIENDNLSSIVSLYRAYQSSEPLLIQSARKQRRKSLLNNIFGFVGIISLIATVLFWIISPPRMHQLLMFIFK